MTVVAAGVGAGVLVDAGSAVQAANSAQQVTTAPTLTKPRRLSATRSPQSERPDTRRDLGACLSAFQSVGQTLQALARGGSMHSKGERDRNDSNAPLHEPKALSHSSCPWIASDVICRRSICQSGVVRSVVRPARGVVRLAPVLSMRVAINNGAAMRLVDQDLQSVVRGV